MNTTSILHNHLLLSRCSPTPLLSLNEDLKISQFKNFDIKPNQTLKKVNYIKSSIHNPQITSSKGSFIKRLFFGTQSENALTDFCSKGLKSLHTRVRNLMEVKYIKCDFSGCTLRKGTVLMLFEDVFKAKTLSRIYFDLNNTWIPLFGLLAKKIRRGLSMHPEVKILSIKISGVKINRSFSLEFLFREIGKVRNLRTLCLEIFDYPNPHDKSLDSLSNSLRLLKNLSRFQLGFGDSYKIFSKETLERFGSSLGELGQLEHLKIEFMVRYNDNSSSMMLNSIDKLQNLKSLKVRELSSKIGDFIGSLEKLEELELESLELQGNDAEQLFNSISKLKYLKSLNINPYKELIPNEVHHQHSILSISKWKNLEEFKFNIIGKEKIDELFQAISELSLLKVLFIFQA